MTASTFLLLSAFGGVVALDGASVAQVLLSRPLVAGGIAGWLLGDPTAGFTVGVVVELILLPVFPVGGGRFPEGGPATVAGVGAAVQAGGGAPGLAVGVMVALVVAQLGGSTVALLRRTNGKLVPDPARGQMSEAEVVGGHLSALLVDFLRGVLLVGLALALTGLLSQGVRRWWPLSEGATEGLLLTGAAVSLGALLRALGGWRRRMLPFLVGLGAGLAIVGLAA